MDAVGVRFDDDNLPAVVHRPGQHFAHRTDDDAAAANQLAVGGCKYLATSYHRLMTGERANCTIG